MRRSVCKYLSTLAALAALAACGSTPPSKHYLLRAQPVPPPQRAELSLGVGPVTIPQYLKRDAMVFSTDGNQLQITAGERWAEPLEDGIIRVLSLNLAGLLQTQDIRLYPWHPGRSPDYGLKVRVLQLDAFADSAQLTAEWLLFHPGDDSPVDRRIARLQAPLSAASGQKAEAVARVYSELLFELSQQVAQAIREAESRNAAAEEVQPPQD